MGTRATPIFGRDQVQTPDQVHPDQQRRDVCGPSMRSTQPHSRGVTCGIESAHVAMFQECVERTDCSAGPRRPDDQADPCRSMHTDRDATRCGHRLTKRCRNSAREDGAGEREVGNVVQVGDLARQLVVVTRSTSGKRQSGSDPGGAGDLSICSARARHRRE